MGRRGFTLVELMVAIALIAVLASLAAPELEAFLARQRVQSALNLLTAEVHYTRSLAVRSGRGAVLRLIGSADCAGARLAGHGYRVVVRGSPERLVRAGSVRMHGPSAVCLVGNNSDTIAFNSRGLLVPFANRKLIGVLGSVRDSLTISVVGRVYRRF
ncbi:MAG TPA: prepilin-type N-terminal cleavage/methylation domain-containing protein [Longimicrobium sp.]|nr:prepilin-type N-terminal cleavage/methylation domain-containing protein [Longimicrobium sp.]